LTIGAFSWASSASPSFSTSGSTVTTVGTAVAAAPPPPPLAAEAAVTLVVVVAPMAVVLAVATYELFNVVTSAYNEVVVLWLHYILIHNMSVYCLITIM